MKESCRETSLFYFFIHLTIRSLPHIPPVCINDRGTDIRPQPPS